jgi:hypothetical protein
MENPTKYINNNDLKQKFKHAGRSPNDRSMWKKVLDTDQDDDLKEEKVRDRTQKKKNGDRKPNTVNSGSM